jgi:hypothetical protein
MMAIVHVQRDHLSGLDGDFGGSSNSPSRTDDPGAGASWSAASAWRISHECVRWLAAGGWEKVVLASKGKILMASHSRVYSGSAQMHD